jgi:hypothetical protein
MNDNINTRLREIRNENKIWIIYIGLIILSYIANYYEQLFLFNKSSSEKEKYRIIMIIVFSILLCVYLYYFIDSYNTLKSIDKNVNSKAYFLNVLALIASLLIVISGLLYLYVLLYDENLDVEIAFS